MLWMLYLFIFILSHTISEVMLRNSRQDWTMGRKLRFIQQSITDLCKRLDDLNVELTRASVEDQELFLSEIKNVRKALDDDLAEVYIKGYFYVEISMSHILNQKVFQDQHSNFNSSLRNLSFILLQLK